MRSTSTKVSGHGFFDVVEIGCGIAIKECFAGHHHAGSAIAALEGIALDKSLLEGVELIALGESFDGGDLCVVGVDREHHTRANGFTVDLDGTTATRTAITDHLGSG